MSDLAFLLAPSFTTFFLGMLLRWRGILDGAGTDTLIKVIFNLALPALLLSVIPQVELRMDMLAIPAASLLIIFTTLIITAAAGKAAHLENRILGVLLAGTSIMNLGFIMPFVNSFFGDEGLARLFLFYLPNSISAYTLAYLIASRYGSGGSEKLPKKLATSPPFWALGIGLLLNLCEVPLSPLLLAPLTSLGELAIPLLLLALGASVRIKSVQPLPLIMGLTLRMGLGMGLGFAFSAILGLEGMSRAVVVLCSSAPAGLNTLAYASLEGLDRDFAATLVSACMLASLCLLPLLLFLL